MFASQDFSRASWSARSGWSVNWELKRWVKAWISCVPGRIGSGLRRRFYGFKTCGKDVFLGEGFFAEYPGNIEIGDHVGLNRDCLINAGGGVVFEDWVLVGPRVTIYSQNHDIDGDQLVPLAMRGDIRLPVRIGHGAWLGAGATILPGVTVGEGAVVAAGAVVTADVPPRSVVGGVPARVIRLLADE